MHELDEPRGGDGVSVVDVGRRGEGSSRKIHQLRALGVYDRSRSNLTGVRRHRRGPFREIHQLGKLIGGGNVVLSMSGDGAGPLPNDETTG